ncbi:MAG TPA: hypothetical protein VE869_01980 [Gemmatimonas sp.]|nr:hypothetical protein [Gemmatimonas sp.]
MIRFEAVRARFLADTAFDGGGAAYVLARGLEHIGWLSVREPTPETLASHLVMLLDACVHKHRDVSMLTYEIAAVLRDAGPDLDGGLPPIEAYTPAAEDLLQLYVNNFTAVRPPVI